VILRDDDDMLRAFNNVLRASRCASVPPGRSVFGKLVCPYHQWTYDLERGDWRGTAYGHRISTGPPHLKPVLLRDIGGLYIACLSDDPPEIRAVWRRWLNRVWHL